MYIRVHSREHIKQCVCVCVCGVCGVCVCMCVFVCGVCGVCVCMCVVCVHIFLYMNILFHLEVQYMYVCAPALHWGPEY